VLKCANILGCTVSLEKMQQNRKKMNILF